VGDKTPVWVAAEGERMQFQKKGRKHSQRQEYPESASLCSSCATLGLMSRKASVYVHNNRIFTKFMITGNNFIDDTM
jgi:hypothetical protein